MADISDIKCNNCDKKLGKDAKFCGECGTRVVSAPVVAIMSCKKCKAPISDEHKFCPSCGEKVLSESDSSKLGSFAKETGAVVHKPDVKTTQTDDGQCVDVEITKPHTETTKPLTEYTKPDDDKCVDDKHDAAADDDDDDKYFEPVSTANDQNLSSNDNLAKQRRVKSRR